MFTIKNFQKIVLIFILCILYCTLRSEGKPLRRRSVSEVQLMHNLGEHRHMQERQEWLQIKLKDVHTAALRNAERGERARTRRFLPEDVSGLDELTADGIEYLYVLEKILNRH